MGDLEFASVVKGIVIVAISFALSLGWLVIVYQSLMSPLKRRERARLFLDLIQRKVANGETVTSAIVEISECKDSIVSARLGEVCKSIANGCKLSDALDVAKNVLPQRVVALFRVGEETGNIARVLPAAQRVLSDAGSRAWSTTNYLAVLTLSSVFSGLAIVGLLRVVVYPKFLMIARDLGATPPLVLSNWSVWAGAALALVLTFLFVFIFLSIVISWCLPRYWERLERLFTPFWHAAGDRLPWVRLRRQRDFSVTLAAALDGGLPDDRAVHLAREASVGSVIARMAERVEVGIRKGIPLPDALRAATSGDRGLAWHLSQRPGPDGFLKSLAGWHNSLEARAFLSEQLWSQMISTGIVMLHGIWIGMIVIWVFRMLIAITNSEALW